MNSRVGTTWKGRFEWGINNRENRAIVSCVHCTTMFPAAHRYRAESDRTNVANKVSCFPRERERGRGRWGGGGRGGGTRAGYFKVASYNGDH